MIVYEKENKLNIKFDGKIDETTVPDFSLYKNDEDKVIIDANGGQSEPGTGGGGSAPLVVTFTKRGAYAVDSDKTEKEIFDAVQTNGILAKCINGGTTVFEPVAVDIGGNTIYFAREYNTLGCSYIFGNGEDDNTEWTIPD